MLDVYLIYLRHQFLYIAWQLTRYFEVINLLLPVKSTLGENNTANYFYRAMHFSAKRSIAIACRLSVRLSVTLVNCDHTGWNSSKIISPLVSLGRSLFAPPHDGSAPKGAQRNFRPNEGGVLKKWLSAYKSSNISETRQDITKVAIEVE